MGHPSAHVDLEPVVADSFYDWLQGSPEKRAEDLEYQNREFAKKKNSPAYRALNSMRDEPFYERDMRTSIDPRALRMQMVMDELSPRRSSDAWDAEEAVGDYAFNMGQRIRDTGIRSAQQFAQGDLAGGAGLALRALPSAVAPNLAAGRPDMPDDWRKVAEKQGVSPGTVMAIEYGTDPEMWLTGGAALGAARYLLPEMPMMAARYAAKTPGAVLKAIERARYGAGAVTELVDPAGDVIRRLRNTPVPYGP